MISWIVLHVEPRFSLFSWTHQKIYWHRLFEPGPRLKGSSNEDLGPTRRCTETLRIPLGTTRFKCYQSIVLLERRFLTREGRSYESPSSLQTFTSPYEEAVVWFGLRLLFIFYYALVDLFLGDTILTIHHCHWRPLLGWCTVTWYPPTQILNQNYSRVSHCSKNSSCAFAYTETNSLRMIWFTFDTSVCIPLIYSST